RRAHYQTASPTSSGQAAPNYAARAYTRPIPRTALWPARYGCNLLIGFPSCWHEPNGCIERYTQRPKERRAKPGDAIPRALLLSPLPRNPKRAYLTLERWDTWKPTK